MQSLRKIKKFFKKNLRLQVYYKISEIECCESKMQYFS